MGNIMGNKVSYTILDESSDSDDYEECFDDINQLEKHAQETTEKQPVRPNVFSWIIVNWIGHLIRQGNKRPLENEDLFSLDCILPSEQVVELLENAWKDEVRNAASVKGKKPKLWRALIKLHGVGAYVWAVLLNIILVLLSVIQPIFLSFILSHLMLYGVDEHIYMVYVFIVMIFILIILMAITETFFIKNVCVFAVHFRSSLVGLALKKVQTMSAASIAQFTSGHVINLVTKDLEPVEPACLILPYIISVPIQIIAVALVLWWLVSWKAVLCVVYTVVTIIYQIAMSQYLQHLRFKIMTLNDIRVRLLSDMISGIRVLKASAWEWFFQEQIESTRSREQRIQLKTNLVRSSVRSTFLTYVNVTTMIAMVIMVLTGEQLTPQNVFTTIALIGATQAVAQQFAYAFIVLSRWLPSLERMEDFLTRDSLSQNRPGNSLANGGFHDQVFRSGSVPYITPSIKMTKVSCVWTNDSSEGPLHNINLDVRGNTLLAVTGSVGAGKSSLLHAISGELLKSYGILKVKGNIAYVSQSAWIFSGTVRDNILFGQGYDEKKYQKIISACALSEDMAKFPKGDLTQLGERGVSLSGGQKSRVSLARAVYYDADIYLLDDPLSAVDNKVGKHIFENCILGLLADRLNILVTHHLQYTNQADYILVLEEGTIIKRGTFQEMQLDSEFCNAVAQYKNKAVVDDVAPEKERKEDVVEETGAEGLDPTEERNAIGAVSWRTNWGFFRAGNNIFVILLLAFLALIPALANIAVNIWLAILSRMIYNLQVRIDNLATYIGLVGGYLLSLILVGILLSHVCISSSKNLHKNMVSAVLKSVVRFFDTNPDGRILNRFTQDMAQLDDALPDEIFQVAMVAFQLVGNVVIICVANYYSIPVLLVYMVLSKLLYSYHLRVARDLKILDVINGSNVYSQFAETMRGILTIRAQRQEKAMLQTLCRMMDKWSQSLYLYYLSYRWAYFRLDVICAFMVAIVSMASIWAQTNAAFTGLAISMALSLLLQLRVLLFMTSFLESKMVSVERVLNYGELEAEPGYENEVKPPDGWPHSGAITLEDVSLTYYPGGPEVLHHLNAKIEAGEKVGVVGRTGAGKTSLTAAFSRMPDAEGKVFIDDIDINSINIQSAREVLAIIPQIPFLFNGTLRQNLDPGHNFRDTQIWMVLEQVQLKDLLEKRLEKGNLLHLVVTENGANFSAGERQLICMARLLLRETKIIILDEATANIDYQTDQIIQNVIRNELQGQTVVTIAHRLDTVLDYDKIMVMDSGRIVEFDSPTSLLQRKDSHFSRLFYLLGNIQAGYKEIYF